MLYQSLLLVKHKIHCAENEKQQLFYSLFFAFGPFGEFLLDTQSKAWDRQSDINKRPPCVKFDIFSQSFVTTFFATSTVGKDSLAISLGTPWCYQVGSSFAFRAAFFAAQIQPCYGNITLRLIFHSTTSHRPFLGLRSCDLSTMN